MHVCYVDMEAITIAIMYYPWGFRSWIAFINEHFHMARISFQLHQLLFSGCDMCTTLNKIVPHYETPVIYRLFFFFFFFKYCVSGMVHDLD